MHSRDRAELSSAGPSIGGTACLRPHSARATVVGYPGDHLGVSLSLTSPASTLYGSAAWRLPLHLLDDQPFCERIAAEIPAFLAARPLGDAVNRGSRWMDLQRTSIAAQRALESDSQTAHAAYERTPTAETLLAWQDTHHLLQALHTEAAKGAALQAGIVWQFYGEQSTFWFHHLARERQGRTELQALRTGSAPDSPRVVLDHPAGRDQGGDLLRAYYSGESASSRRSRSRMRGRMSCFRHWTGGFPRGSGSRRRGSW